MTTVTIDRASGLQPIHTRPALSELMQRRQKLAAEMERHGLDHLVLVDPHNIFYLTNFANFVHERPFVLVLSHKGELTFVIPLLELPHVSMRAIGPLELVTYAEFPAPAGRCWDDRLRDVVPMGARVGIEPTCPFFIARALPGEPAAVDLIERLRMVKSEYELGRIQYACDLATIAHDRFLANARVGQTMREAAGAMSSDIMSRLIADDPAINLFATKLTLVFQPPSISHDPHNFTDINVALEEGGPNVSIVNGIMNGYGAEVERTFFLGRVPEHAKRPYDTMMRAREAALAHARLGNRMSDVDLAAIRVFREAGYAGHLLHRTGHGIGVTGHEGPFFAEGHDEVISQDMVFTVEPGVYIEGIGGFRHSDTVRIASDGPVLMTSGPLSIEDLTL